MPTKNLRQGRVKIRSGDSVVLEKIAPFSEGDFTFTRTKNTIQVKNRGSLDHLRKGDEEAVTFTFSAKFVDKTLRRTLEEFIFDGKTKNVTGLTGGALNENIPLDYAYEQDSLQVAASETAFTKIANGATPISGEFAEELKTRDDLEEVAMVGDAELVTPVPGEFAVFMPGGDTDLNVVYDAIGKSTLDPGTSDVKTFTIDLEKLDVALAKQGIVDEIYRLRNCVLETVEQAEGDEFDLVTFTGFAYVSKPDIITV
ncbi:hypothetical protein LCGC14_0995580 [marine sediment metagenome]|uniref:Uncharacterized protein n=1 Tax=marine sediment metagenome TaxID=412755 RepID=A0A0F9NQY6_9ZZZZ